MSETAESFSKGGEILVSDNKIIRGHMTVKCFYLRSWPMVPKETTDSEDNLETRPVSQRLGIRLHRLGA